VTIHMRITSRRELIADLPEWDGPVPAPGDYLFHPPFGDQDVIPDIVATGIAGCVKTRTWRTHDRPSNPGAASFVMTAHPYVEITI
jgi:hypothetical protein